MVTTQIEARPRSVHTPMDYLLSFNCPSCEKLLKAKSIHAGKRVRCTCGYEIRLPGGSETLSNKPSAMKKDFGIGVVGIILVSFGLLRFFYFFKDGTINAFYLIGSFGCLAALIGLIVCIVALFHRGNRLAGLMGITEFFVISLVCSAIRI